MKWRVRCRCFLNPPAPPRCPLVYCLPVRPCLLIRSSVGNPKPHPVRPSLFICLSACLPIWQFDCPYGICPVRFLICHVRTAHTKHRPLLDAYINSTPPGLTYPSSRNSHWAPSLYCAFKESDTIRGSKDFGKLE